MPQFPWIRQSCIEIGRIDEEHALLLKVLSNISSAMHANDVKTATNNALLFKDIITNHFIYEEDLMRRVDYPHRDGHIGRHDFARSQAAALLTELKMSANSISVAELISAIAAHLYNTLLTDDLRLVRHLQRT